MYFAPKCVALTHDALLVPTTGKYLFRPAVIGGGVVVVGFPAKIISKTKALEEKRAALLQDSIFDLKKCLIIKMLLNNKKNVIM